MAILTIINSIFIAGILWHKLPFRLRVYTRRTLRNSTFLGYTFELKKREKNFIISTIFGININLRNVVKTRLREEIEFLIQSTDSVKDYRLSVKFSDLKTWKEVRKFEKDYAVVDRKTVERLVASFTPKNNEVK